MKAKSSTGCRRRLAKIPACMASMAMHSIHATARSAAVMDFTELCRQCTVYAKVIAGASR